MATKKDLVEAYSFSRRRLVTAFVSGAPGGREVEPTRPGRAIVGGVALAVLLVAGGAVLGIIKSPSTVDFSEEGLVSEKESGADYLVMRSEKDPDDPEATELRPLANITSALLIFGPDLESKDVARDKLSEQPRGAPIGILGAPATPPERGKLVETGWTACTGGNGSDQATGVRVDVSETPTVTPSPTISFAVRTESGDVYVVTESSGGVTRGDQVQRAYAYPVPAGDDQSRIVRVLTGATELQEVPDQWITLFPAGRELSLQTFGIEDGEYGKPWPDAAEVPDAKNPKIGDLLTVGDQETFLLTAGKSVRLDEFSSALYANLDLPRKRNDPKPVQQGPNADVVAAGNLDDAFWPTTIKAAYQPTGQYCALLDTPADTQPGVLLATADPLDVTAEPVAAETVATTVESGHGAFVRSGDFEAGGPVSRVLVDDRGYRYKVGDGEEQTKLGYGDVPFVEVPSSWVNLFRQGVPLTVDAARCPPTSDPDGGCS